MNKKIVYISCPYTKGDVAVNVRNSIFAQDEVIEAGHLPFNPLMSHFHHMLVPHNYEYWMDIDLEWVKKSDIVIRLPGESSGADRECALAKELGIQVLELEIEEIYEALSS